LRKKLLGKYVNYVIDNKAGTREYGQVYLNDENVSRSVVGEGWAKVIAPTGGKEAKG